MAGHSKFKNIQHRKGAQDAKRAKIFTKLGREIAIAAKLGGSDPEMNPRLRLAITTARGSNMPNDRIKKAVQSGVGSDDMSNYVEMRYEGYGPSGVAVIVEALTDNKNRTASEVRSAFSKSGGNLGETGSVGFMFDHMGEVIYSLDKTSEDEMFESAVEAGADNVETADCYEVSTSVEDFISVKNALEEKYGEAERAGFIWKPNVSTEVNEDTAAKILRLIDALEDNDDVQSVTTNLECSDEIMEKLLSE